MREGRRFPRDWTARVRTGVEGDRAVVEERFLADLEGAAEFAGGQVATGDCAAHGALIDAETLGDFAGGEIVPGREWFGHGIHVTEWARSGEWAAARRTPVRKDHHFRRFVQGGPDGGELV